MCDLALSENCLIMQKREIIAKNSPNRNSEKLSLKQQLSSVKKYLRPNYHLVLGSLMSQS